MCKKTENKLVTPENGLKDFRIIEGNREPEGEVKNILLGKIPDIEISRSNFTRSAMALIVSIEG